MEAIKHSACRLHLTIASKCLLEFSSTMQCNYLKNLTDDLR